MIKIYDNNVAGSTYCILHLYEDADCENEIASTNPPTTSDYSLGSENLILHPNPTNDLFRIKNDDQVNSLEIVNSIGQTLIRIPHGNNEMHSTSTLPKGLYAVVLRDSENEILKSLSLFRD